MIPAVLFLGFVLHQQVPSAPTIAILPVVNRTAERDLKLKEDMTVKLTESLNRVFKLNGFTVVESSKVVEGMSASHFDITDEEMYFRAPLLKTGKAILSDYIFFVVMDHHEMVSKGEARTFVRCWFLDVRTQARVYSAKPFVGISGKVVLGRTVDTRLIQSSQDVAFIAVEDGCKILGREFRRP